MEDKTVEIEESGRDVFVAEIPPAKSTWDILRDASWKGGFWGLFVLAGVTIIAMGSESSSATHVRPPDGGGMLANVPAIYVVAAAVGIFTTAFLFVGLSEIWKERRLNHQGRLEIRDSRLEFRGSALLAPSPEVSCEREGFDFVQRTEIPDDSLAIAVPEGHNHEVTLATVEGMHILCCGHSKSESIKLVEHIERVASDGEEGPDLASG